MVNFLDISSGYEIEKLGKINDTLTMNDSALI